MMIGTLACVAVAAQAAADLDAGEVLYHPVEQHDVRYALLRHDERFLAIRRVGDIEAFLAEMPGDEFRQRGVVLDQQHMPTAHGNSPLIAIDPVFCA
jgi:hypothetical protein